MLNKCLKLFFIVSDSCYLKRLDYFIFILKQFDGSGYKKQLWRVMNRLRINIDFAIFLNPFLYYCHGIYVQIFDVSVLKINHFAAINWNTII